MFNQLSWGSKEREKGLEINPKWLPLDHTTNLTEIELDIRVIQSPIENVNEGCYNSQFKSWVWKREKILGREISQKLGCVNSKWKRDEKRKICQNYIDRFLFWGYGLHFLPHLCISILVSVCVHSVEWGGKISNGIFACMMPFARKKMRWEKRMVTIDQREVGRQFAENIPFGTCDVIFWNWRDRIELSKTFSR